MTDDDLWKAYTKGVKRKGAAEEPGKTVPQEEAQPERTEKTCAERPMSAARESISLDTMPEAWRAHLGGEAFSLAPERTPEPVTEAARTKEEPQTPPAKPMPRGAWRREPLDPRVERNLSLGDVFVEGKLDLHGMTEEAAHEKLLGFIETAQKRGKRIVLVITGKGRDGEAVLRQNVPRWCDVPPLDDLVWAIRTAAPLHGGDGAYYLLLQKKKVDV